MEDIKLKYDNLDEKSRKAAVLFVTNRMINEGVPFADHENVDKLLTIWNPTIVLNAGLMKMLF